MDLGYSTLKTPQRKVITAAVLFGAFYGIKQMNAKAPLNHEQLAAKAARDKKNRGKGNVDREFW